MTTAVNEITAPPQAARRRVPRTFWVGLVWILACEVLLFADVAWSGRAPARTHEQIESTLAESPTAALPAVARWMAVNMTPLVWIGYVVLLEGVLTWQTGASPVRRRPHHFALLCLASVVIWCVFDWINFYFLGAWTYIGMPPEDWAHRYWGYLIAFGTIVPGMLMTGQVFLNLGWFDRARGRAWRMPRWAKWVALAGGAALAVLPLFRRDALANLAIWTGLVFLLDPINLKLGRPAMFRDWQAGWYGRTLAAFAGGLTCGLLWEFWNYWALIKWTYQLPFLGALEHVRYFEMPVPGLVGFVPFGIECWVMWQTLRIPLDGLAEPLPDERSLL